MADSLMHQLTRFICQDHDHALPDAVLEAALRTVLDTLAVTLAAGSDPALARLEASFDAQPRRPGARSPWSGRSLAPDDAALLFGMASHMHDYDDVSMLATCHPSAPVLSAMLAWVMADPDCTVSGRQWLQAHALGTEVLIRLGQAMGFRHYALGFHATSTLGVIGATAALARLARLDAGPCTHALAIAASMAAGLRKNFGSDVKPLHVGLTAASALRALRMAQAGVQGAAEVFEGQGYLFAFSGGVTASGPASGLALGRPYALVDPGFEQKRYPCCYMLHKMIEAVLALRRAHGLGLEAVVHARVLMPRGGTQPLIHPRPLTGLNGKFSAPYAVMAALADGRIDLASFSDEAVQRPALQAALARVEVIEEGEEPPQGSDLGSMPVTVSLDLADGRRLTHTVRASPGSPEDPLSPAQLRTKWQDCLRSGSPRLHPDGFGAGFDQGLHLVDAPRVRPWLAQVLGA